MYRSDFRVAKTFLSSGYSMKFRKKQLVSHTILLARLHFSAEELLLYPRRQRPRRRLRRRRRPHAKC